MWFAAGTLAVVLLYGWGLLLWHLSVFWRMLPDYAYGWAVPVLTLILLWRRRHALGPPTGLLDPATAVLAALLRRLGSSPPALAAGLLAAQDAGLRKLAPRAAALAEGGSDSTLAAVRALRPKDKADGTAKPSKVEIAFVSA